MAEEKLSGRGNVRGVNGECGEEMSGAGRWVRVWGMGEEDCRRRIAGGELSKEEELSWGNFGWKSFRGLK